MVKVLLGSGEIVQQLGDHNKRVWFLSPMLSSFQLPVTPALGEDQIPFSDLHRLLYTCKQTHTHTSLEQNHFLLIWLTKIYSIWLCPTQYFAVWKITSFIWIAILPRHVISCPVNNSDLRQIRRLVPLAEKELTNHFGSYCLAPRPLLSPSIPLFPRKQGLVWSSHWQQGDSPSW